ncbi:MAG: hypothetical protein ABI599_06800 [Flavobacteriales bacterium]
MRSTLLLLAYGASGIAQGQSVMSVQDGDWDDPATWDCACVPTVQNTLVLHAVQITANMFLSMQEMTVGPSGLLTMDLPHSLAVMESVLNAGTMLLKGNIDVDGEITNNGMISIDGNLFLDNLLVMDGPGTLLTTTNIGNAGLITGSGRICVDEVSDNDGTIQGTIDFCDATPTTITPPIIDFNTGTVDASVTYCLTGGCSEAIGELDGLDLIRAWPVPSAELLTLEHAPNNCSLQLHDALGHTVPITATQETDRITLDVRSVPAGCYHVVVSTAAHRRCMPIVVVH